MIERKGSDYSFSIPIQRPINGSWRSPFSYGYDNYRPAVPIRTPYEDFETHPTGNRCQCSGCHHGTQRQRDYGLRQQRIPKRDSNRSVGAFREIPILIESQKIKAAPGIDGPENIPRKVPEDVQADDLKKVSSSSDECSNAKNLRGNQSDSQSNPEMKTASTSNEKDEEMEVEEAKQRKLGKIAEISAEVDKLAERVTAFQGKKKCKEYLYVEEMLTKCLLKLDGISADGFTDVRTSRKKVASTASEWLQTLEEKLEEESASQMMETPESADSTETKEASSCKADSEENSIGETTEVKESELVDANEFNKVDSKPGSEEISCEAMEDQGIADMSCDEEDIEQLNIMEVAGLENESSSSTEHLAENKEQSEKLVVDEIAPPKVLKC